MNKDNKDNKVTRRSFLLKSTIGLGVLIGTAYVTRPVWRRKIFELVNSGEAPYLGPTSEPMIWFEITSDNRVIFHSPKVEMGQGVFTGLAQMAADELDITMEQIEVVHADTDSGNIDEFATGGSTSIAGLWVPLRELAATIREMLKIKASELMKVDPSSLTIEKGIIKTEKTQMSYGEVVEKNRFGWKIPNTPQLKDISEYKYIGNPVPRVDLLKKVTGAPIYGMDATLPDMVYGSIIRASHVDAKIISIDTSVAEIMPGVLKIIQEEDFVGVVAESIFQAENAKKAIKITWKNNRKWDYQDIKDKIRVGQGTPIVIQKKGNVNDVFDDSSMTSEYWSPIGAHAQLEPNGALAHVKDGKATIYISTQVIKLTRKEVAKRLGISKKDVNIIPTFLGGGFGRRLHTPNAVQAATMSKIMEKPVKCFFTRQEEFQNDTFRPPTHHTLTGHLTADGKIAAIEHNVSSGDVMFGSALIPEILGKFAGADVGAWRGGMFQYRDIPNYEATSWRVKLPFATSWWRSLGLLANTFAIESFFDEMAEKAGKDPIDFRIEHIQDDKAGIRLRKVIETARTASNYRNEAHNERAMGFAASTDVNTPCAHVAEVSIIDDRIKVHKVTCVMDPGMVINPDQVRAQCEGSVIMGMSAALYEKMDLENNILRPTIYGPYQMALMKNAPQEINVILLENDDKPGGVGEPPLGPIGAAIANAVYRLTGQRRRSMPLDIV